MTLNYTEIANWISHDPDPKTREELIKLQDAALSGDASAQSDLADRFQGLLQFGTAGLRGEMGGGPFRMNRAVVRKATAGLVAWLKARVGTDAVVSIGFDARYNSRDFANDVAGIVTAAGMRAIIFPRELPTPVLAYSVRKLGADAGVMITASHNPPQDNGYKLYLGGRAIDETGNGVQIVPPVDGEIAAEIAAIGHADEIPVASEGWELLPEEIVGNYIQETAELVKQQPVRDLKIVYTAMHGVGYETMSKVFAAAGFTDVHGVPEQIQPDPDFPTVSFPNPEEAGALDLAMAYAAKVDADIIIASDPDADRASAAIPNGDGTWRQLSGDEIGTVLGEVVAKSVGQTASASDAVLASSIVSSRILGPIAQQYGLRHVATLTGFKWIARPEGIVYGYEEAIGFCVNPNSVKDKDGISAGLVIASTAAQLKAAGKSLADELDRIYSEHGVYLTGPVTIRVEDLSIIPATMQKIRTTPPVALAGSPVASIVDLNEGTAELPPTDAVMIHTEANDRVIIRPSGTEPKVKCYLEVIVPLTDSVDLAAAKNLAAQRLEQFKADMVEALKL